MAEDQNARNFRAESTEIMTAAERQVFLRNSGYGRVLGISGVHLPNSLKPKGDPMTIEQLRTKHKQLVIAKEQLEEGLIDSGCKIEDLRKNPQVIELQKQLDVVKDAILDLM